MVEPKWQDWPELGAGALHPFFRGACSYRCRRVTGLGGERSHSLLVSTIFSEVGGSIISGGGAVESGGGKDVRDGKVNLVEKCINVLLGNFKKLIIILKGV